MSHIAKSAHSGDRLIVYVTSHGSEGKKDDPYNTTIDCWNDKEITVREFSQWLAEFPADVPVVMVMAQCYCGGFGHAVFEDFKVPDDAKTLAKQLRVGGFAQQHNLSAATRSIFRCVLLMLSCEPTVVWQATLQTRRQLGQRPKHQRQRATRLPQTM